MTALPLRILYVLPYVPSPVRVRPYELIRALARAGHYVTVAALADDFASAESLAELRRVCRAVHVVPHPKRQGMAQAALALFTPTPLWAAFCYSPTMHTLLRDLIATEPFDVAHVEHLRAAHFAPALAPLPLVFDAVDCVTALQKQLLAASGSPVSRLLAWEEWHKLRAYEPKVCRVFARITITSAHDAADLRGLDPALPPITVIPNGVDSAYFAPDPSVAPEPDMLIFSGKMSYAPNDDAARFLLTQILPPLRRLRPGVRVIVGGSKPSAALKRLAARTPGVTVTGFVNDLRPFLARATLAVCPVRVGVGIQNKVLEAMAMGRPVVCSPLAARALPGAVAANAGVRVADGADDFARVCAELLAAPVAYLTQSGAAARAYVARQHDWAVAADDFVQLYRTVIAAKRTSAAG